MDQWRASTPIYIIHCVYFKYWNQVDKHNRGDSCDSTGKHYLMLSLDREKQLPQWVLTELYQVQLCQCLTKGDSFDRSQSGRFSYTAFWELALPPPDCREKGTALNWWHRVVNALWGGNFLWSHLSTALLLCGYWQVSVVCFVPCVSSVTSPGITESAFVGRCYQGPPLHWELAPERDIKYG